MRLLGGGIWGEGGRGAAWFHTISCMWMYVLRISNPDRLHTWHTPCPNMQGFPKYARLIHHWASSQARPPVFLGSVATHSGRHESSPSYLIPRTPDIVLGSTTRRRLHSRAASSLYFLFETRFPVQYLKAVKC